MPEPVTQLAPPSLPPKRWNLIGDNFTHTSGGHTGLCGTHGKTPRKIQWSFSDEGEVDFFLDFHFVEYLDSPRKRPRFAWLLESKSVRPGLYERVAKDHRVYLNAYDAIFTHDRELLSLDPRFKFCPVSGSWIQDAAIHPKTRLVSAISSTKSMSEGHKWRLDFIERYRDRFDLFGNGFRAIERKEIGLSEYMFSVAIENGSYATYFTEKVLDCFATGTVPIYRGAPDIAEHFNPNGILFVDVDGSFQFDALSEELYVARFDAIRDNFERVKRLHCAEDWIFETYRQEFGF